MLSAPNAKATFTGTASDEESSLQLFVLLLTLFLTLGIFTPGGIEINNKNNSNVSYIYIYAKLASTSCYMQCYVSASERNVFNLTKLAMQRCFPIFKPS